MGLEQGVGSLNLTNTCSLLILIMSNLRSLDGGVEWPLSVSLRCKPSSLTARLILAKIVQCLTVFRLWEDVLGSRLDDLDRGKIF